MRNSNYCLLQLWWCLGLILLVIQAKATKVSFGGKLAISHGAFLLDENNEDTRPSYGRVNNRYSDSLLALRGGSDEEGEEDEDEEGEESSTGVNASPVLDKVGTIAKKMIILVGKVTVSTAKGFQRALSAGLKGDEVEDDEPVPFVQKVINTMQRMVKAAFTFPEADDQASMSKSDSSISSQSNVGYEEDDEGSDGATESSSSSTSISQSDFGTFLSSSYGVTDGRGESGPPVLGGTLGNALQMARAQARLLVILIPSARPSKKKRSKDALAIEGILSAEVAKAANKRARKSGEETGSFLFWGAKAGASEATAAIKRLKAKATSSKGEKRPILMVVYPAQVLDSSGVKIVPQVIAQHHCSPPPTDSLMASWLNALRKRHAKQYNAMQTELKEVQYFKERSEGYRESVQSDIERKQREKEEEAKRLVEEKAEKERKAAVEERRKDLKAALPEEPTQSDAKKIAVRFADGRSGQRRFSPDTKVSVLFNWVDAMYDLERENVVLTTMNGQKTLTWDEENNEKTLDEVGLGKMTGFRVAEKKEETEVGDSSEEES